MDSENSLLIALIEIAAKVNKSKTTPESLQVKLRELITAADSIYRHGYYTGLTDKGVKELVDSISGELRICEALNINSYPEDVSHEIAYIVAATGYLRRGHGALQESMPVLPISVDLIRTAKAFVEKTKELVLFEKPDAYKIYDGSRRLRRVFYKGEESELAEFIDSNTHELFTVRPCYKDDL